MSRYQPPEDHWVTLGWAVAVIAWVLLCLIGQSGCTVRSVTTCLTYDRALARPDPNSGISRDAAGASVCAETGPRE